MNTKEKLLQAIKEYPESEIVYIYPSNSYNDAKYTLGTSVGVEVKKIRVHIEGKSRTVEEYNSSIGEIKEAIYAKKYRANMSKVLTDEEIAEIERLAKEEIEKYEWTSVIAVYLG